MNPPRKTQNYLDFYISLSIFILPTITIEKWEASSLSIFKHRYIFSSLILTPLHPPSPR